MDGVGVGPNLIANAPLRQGPCNNIHGVYEYFIRRYRPRRMRQLADYFGLTRQTRVLDVGGTLTNWNLLPFRPRLTLLNLYEQIDNLPEDVTYVRGDACDMPFEDQEFDLVFSNSVIEHVGSWETQEGMAREIQRVGRSYYVQTPNYWFPIEPHLLAPGFHWLPRSIRRSLIRNFTLWGWFTRPGKEKCAAFVDETQLLKPQEMKSLFPEAELLREKLFFMDKSIIAAYRS
jgi:hypothetical protein